METLKAGTSFRGFPYGWSNYRITSLLASKYGVNAKDFTCDNGIYTYNPKKTKSSNKATKRVKRTEKIVDLEGEVWKQLPNKNRYFDGELDPTHLVMVSNMGRVSVGGKLVKTYFAPTRNGMQVHIDTIDAAGMPLRTTGFVANMIADTFIVPNGKCGKKTYYIVYKDNNPQNCVLSNIIVFE